MSKKRTRKQKARATYHYAYPAGRSFQGIESQAGEFRPPIKEKPSNLGLYPTDPQYTRSDLLKTMGISLLMVAVEVGLYFLL